MVASGEFRGLVRAAGLLRRSAPVGIWLLVVLPVAGGIAPAVTAAATGALVDAVGPGADGTVVALPIGLLAGALLLTGLFQSLSRPLSMVVAERFRAALAQQVMGATSSLPGLAHFEDPDTSAQRAIAEWTGNGPLGFLTTMGSLLWQATGTMATAVVAARLTWWAPAALLIVALGRAVFNLRLERARAAARVRHETDDRRSVYLYRLSARVRTAKEARAFGLADWLVERQDWHWTRALGAYLSVLNRRVRVDAFLQLAKVGIGAVAMAVGVQRAFAGSLTPGDLTGGLLALVALMGLAGIFEDAPAAYQRGVEFLPSLWRIVDLPVADPRLDVAGTRTPALPATAGLHCEGVRFRYPGTDTAVLDGFDLHVPAGTSLALVGVNGAGKSTLVKLLCRFYDPDDGRIRLDGIDLRDLDLAALRATVAVEFQDLVHYPLSAADNVGFGAITRRTDRALHEQAAARAGALDLIEGLPDGWDTVLAREFGGADLSSGQWQRIALARTMATILARDPALLILDEPTAALDVRIEHDLYHRFAELTHGRTTLLISHRFSTVRMADRVALVDRGRVVEEGTHDELVDRGGQYAQLFDLQARRFRDGRDGNGT